MPETPPKGAECYKCQKSVRKDGAWKVEKKSLSRTLYLCRTCFPTLEAAKYYIEELFGYNEQGK